MQFCDRSPEFDDFELLAAAATKHPDFLKQKRKRQKILDI